MNTLALSATALALLLAGSCSEGSPSEPAQASEFRLKVGGSASVSGFTFAFVDVVADSRCPTGVTCVWAGEVTVAVDATGSEDTVRLELSLGPDREKAVAALDGLTLRLLRVDPYPKAESQIERSQYEATFKVEPS